MNKCVCADDPDIIPIDPRFSYRDYGDWPCPICLDKKEVDFELPIVNELFMTFNSEHSVEEKKNSLLKVRKEQPESYFLIHSLEIGHFFTLYRPLDKSAIHYPEEVENRIAGSRDNVIG